MTSHAQVHLMHFHTPWGPAILKAREDMNNGLPHPRLCPSHRTRTRSVHLALNWLTILMQMAYVLVIQQKRSSARLAYGIQTLQQLQEGERTYGM